MTDLLQTGSDWLEGQRHEHASHAVTYCRGDDSVALNATVGTTSFDVETEFGIENVQHRDYLIRAEDLILGAVQTEPQRGDRIRETVSGDVLVFEVMAPGREPPWRYSDQNRKTIRVHTKHVATE